MKATLTPTRLICAIVAATAATSLAALTANATLPYSYPLPLPPLGEGKSMITPDRAFGKEFSHDLDITSAPPGGGPDPAQVIAWDGQLPGSGTADGLDFSLPAPPFSTSGNFQVDALANSHDLFFKSLLVMDATGGVSFPDRSHLVFSVDDVAHGAFPAPPGPFPIPAGGPILTTGGNLIGGAGEISFERAGAFAPPSTQGVWATQAEIDGMTLPRDVDGLEIWGPEPVSVAAGGDASGSGDSDKYSVDTDIMTGFPGGAPHSVWNYDISGGTGSSPYIAHSLVTSLVALLLEASNINPEHVNLDALMVQDDFGEDTRFDPGDKIIFSIRQIAATFAPDGSGFFATGSEIFWMDGASTMAAPVGGFLFHGGHPWDKAYAMTHMQTDVLGPDGLVRVQLDLNALEAIGVPEPASAMLLLVGMTAVAVLRRRS
jgi:hypothetical protein